MKSSPVDFRQFRSETSVKYPTFSPPRTGEGGAEKFAAAIAPIPVRPSFYQHSVNLDDDGGPQRLQQQAPPQQLPPTPAPSPPPQPQGNNGRTKKQLYQTDPNRPFLFPFSRGPGASAKKLVPFAIDEADNLYRRHMHVSLALYQMWETRQAFMLDESGVDPDSPEGIATLEKESASVFGAGGPKPNPVPDNDYDDSPEHALPDVRKLDAAIAEAQRALDKSEVDGDRAARRKCKERRDDLVRLRRVESLYVGFTFIALVRPSLTCFERPTHCLMSVRGC